METLTVGRGYTRGFVVQLRYPSGDPILGVYAGTEDLGLVVCDLLGAALVLSASSTVAWCVVTRDADGNITSAVPGSGGGAAGTVLLTLDDSDTADMEAGPRRISIGVTTGGERREAYTATLRVEPRPV